MSEGSLIEKDESQHAMDLDLADEDQIVAEISGRVTDKYIYEMKGVKDERGNPVIGLSYAGTNWACREFARQGEVIRVAKWNDESTPDEPEFYKIAVMAQRFLVDKETGKEIALDTNIAGKRQWKFMKKIKWVNGERAGEEIVPDPFAWEKCLSKATRNAKQTLMPTEMVKKLVAKALEGKSGQAPSAPKGPAKPAGGAAAPKNTTQAAPAGVVKPDEKKAPAGPPTPTGSPATGAPAPTGAPATGAPAPVGSPEAAAPAPAAPAGKPKMTKEVMVQKLDAVCKMVFQTQDGAVARHKLSLLTGRTTPTDLSDDEIKKLGNAINAVAKATATIMGNNIVKISDSSILWKGPEVAAAPAPAAAPAAPPQEEEMF